jgi:hypothetical protein
MIVFASELDWARVSGHGSPNGLLTSGLRRKIGVLIESLLYPARCSRALVDVVDYGYLGHCWALQLYIACTARLCALARMR